MRTLAGGVNGDGGVLFRDNENILTSIVMMGAQL